jgi:hypothetical protein
MAQITDPELLQAALAGYQQQLTEIQDKIAELRKRIGGKAAATAASSGVPKPSRLSPEARARIAAAQRRRWAKTKAAAKAGSPAKKAAPASKKKSSGASAGEGTSES